MNELLMAASKFLNGTNLLRFLLVALMYVTMTIPMAYYIRTNDAKKEKKTLKVLNIIKGLIELNTIQDKSLPKKTRNKK